MEKWREVETEKDVERERGDGDRNGRGDDRWRDKDGERERETLDAQTIPVMSVLNQTYQSLTSAGQTAEDADGFFS